MAGMQLTKSIFWLPLLTMLFWLSPTHADAQTMPTSKPAIRRCVPAVPVPLDRWKGEYFANRELSGAPALVRDDGALELGFDWGLGGPDKDCGLGVDDFSARWSRTIAVASGSYRFTLTADDGARLLLDGQPLLDEWRDQPMTTRTADIELTGGTHRLVLEYYEHLGSAAVKLSWQRTPCLAKVPSDRWRGEYFANRELSGAPQMVSDEGSGFLDFNWGLDAPQAACFNLKDNFSARWTRTIAFAPGTFRFTLEADDGVRLYVDKQLKLESWTDQMAQRALDVELSGGNHLIVLEYYEHFGSAQASLRWEPHPCLASVAPDRWKGEYFATPDLSGAPVLVRDDGASALDLRFGKGKVNAACLTRENFSARWTRKVTFGTGVYRFSLESGERVRVYLDEEKLLDQWQEPKSLPSSIDVNTTAGNHRLRVEFFKQTDDGMVRLFWENVERAAPGKRGKV
jgi:hypothetical protein